MQAKKTFALTSLALAAVLFASTASACPVSNFLNKLFGLKGPSTTVQTPAQG